MIVHPSGVFDNSARDYDQIEVHPIAAAMGAEIHCDPLNQLTDAAFEEVQDALWRHKMIYFVDPSLDHRSQFEFSRRFGSFADDAYTQGVDRFAEVQPVIKEAAEAKHMIFGSGWHTDSPFLTAPPAISLLRSVEIPPYGGDTVWANTALAFSALSATFQERLKALKVHMSMGKVLKTAQEGEIDASPLGKLAATRELDKLPEDLEFKVSGTMHPLVRTHPITGEQALYCDQTYASGIGGMTAEEAAPLLEFLVTHITQAAFTCRLRWQTNMLVVWDNRLCIHQAFNDYDGYRREMYRTTIAGEKPK